MRMRMHMHIVMQGGKIRFLTMLSSRTCTCTFRREDVQSSVQRS